MSRDQSPSKPSGESDVRRIEPGVDEASLRTSKAAGTGPSESRSQSSPTTAPSDTHASDRGPRRALWVTLGIAIAVVSIVVLALLVSVAPALAWIGIALQVALSVMLVVSAGVLPAGGYRASRFVWITAFQVAAAVVVLLLIMGVAALG